MRRERVIVAALALIVFGIGIAFASPSDDTLRLIGVVATVAGVLALVGLLVYRILIEGGGETVVTDNMGADDESAHH